MKTFYFQATSEKSKEIIIIQAKDSIEARHWVINHLDLSQNWTIKEA